MNPIAGCVRCVLAVALLASSGLTGAQPNILLIIADDYGFDQSSLYATGNDVPPTPAVEALAARGVTYANVWSSQSCSPTRATMITGQYGSRNGISGVIVAPAAGLDNRLDYPHFLPRELGALGYATGIVGKWHLARAADSPIGAGFDFFAGRPRSFGPGDGAPTETVAAYWGTYLATYRCTPDCELLTFPESPRQAPVPEELHGNYMTTWEVDQSLGWIADQAGAPWFLWLAFQTPHAPLQLPPAHLVAAALVDRIEARFGRYEAGMWIRDREDPEGERLVFSAMVSSMDTEMARLLAAIDLDETVVIFLGDNGTVSQVANPERVPRGRGKGGIYQGGIHVPMVIAGPGVTEPGARSEALVHTSDIFSTVLDLAGAEMTADGAPAAMPADVIIDGRSLVPTLSGDAVPGRRHILAEAGAVTGNPAFHEQPRFGGRERSAIRNGRYKLVLETVLDENRSFICIDGPQPTADNPVPCGRDERLKSWELYDLDSDPRESQNMLADGVDSLEPEMLAVFEELRDAVPGMRAGRR